MQVLTVNILKRAIIFIESGSARGHTLALFGLLWSREAVRVSSFRGVTIVRSLSNLRARARHVRCAAGLIVKGTWGRLRVQVVMLDRAIDVAIAHVLCGTIFSLAATHADGAIFSGIGGPVGL